MLALQVLTGPPLWALLVLLAGILDGDERRRWRQLARRSRWLILVLALTFVLATPGEALLPGLPATWEGVVAAADQGVRFLLLLGAVAWLLVANTRADLVAGLHFVAAPLRWLGLSTDRGAARLALVLAAIDRAEPGPHWRALLDEGELDVPPPIEIELRPLRAVDVAALATGILLVALALLA